MQRIAKGKVFLPVRQSVRQFYASLCNLCETGLARVHLNDREAFRYKRDNC